MRVSLFPVDDFGFVETNNQWTPTAVVAAREPGDPGVVTELVPVAGSEEAPVGAAICRTGSTTGTRLRSGHGDERHGELPRGRHRHRADPHRRLRRGWRLGRFVDQRRPGPGRDVRRLGRLHVGGTTFFQPVNEILQRNSLTLVTEGGAAPEEPEEPGPAPDNPAPRPTAPVSRSP